MTQQIKNIIKAIILAIAFLASYALKAQTFISDLEHGLYGVDILKIALGCITIIGAFGFFITTSPRKAHWPAYIRRTFFGIFVFCSIINQALFNVIGLPANKKAVTFIGNCIKKMAS